jgi:hypothetical protein
VGLAGDLASRLRDARLSVLEGESIAPYLGDAEAIARVIDEFLREPDRPPAPPEALGVIPLRPPPGSHRSRAAPRCRPRAAGG